MKTWLVGALAGACAGVALYLALSQELAPPPGETRQAPAVPEPTVVSPAHPPAPIVLREVVEVTDIDHLLDPPASSNSGVPFDDAGATIPVAVPVGPEVIPLAADDPVLAPAPRERGQPPGLP
jgi:hypothetical protein